MFLILDGPWSKLGHLLVEMTNKPIPVGIARTRLRFDGNSRIDWVWVWVWVWEIPDFFN